MRARADTLRGERSFAAWKGRSAALKRCIYCCKNWLSRGALSQSLIGQLIQRRRNLSIGDGNDAKITTIFTNRSSSCLAKFLSRLSECIWHATNQTSRVPVLFLSSFSNCVCQLIVRINTVLYVTSVESV